MRYQKLLELLKKSQKISLMVGVPALGFFLILSIVFTFHGSGKPWLPGFIITFIILVLMIELIVSNLNYEKKLDEIKQIVGAANTAEFSQLLDQAEIFEEYYFLTDAYFMNFYKMCAYPRSEIRDVSRTEITDSETGSIQYYCITLKYGKNKRDLIQLGDPTSRDRLYKLLLDHTNIG